MNGLRTAVLVLAAGQTGWAQEAADPEPQYARITAAETQVRCFASDRSPLYGDRLVEGQVVAVAEEESGFRRVLLPLGATGYVHKKFATEAAEGLVEASAEKVAFRYRPVASEVPAVLMAKGTSLYLLGEEGDWWKVANPVAPAYLPSAELQLVTEASSTVEQSYAELQKTRREQWTAAVASREAARQEAEQRRRQSEQLEALAARLQETTADPEAPQDYAQLAAELEALVAALPEGSAERTRAEGLQRAVEQQKLVAQAVAAVAAEPPTEDRAAAILPAEVRDPLARFDAVGWLHRQQLDDFSDYWTLRKGGQVLYSVVCTSRRYDLELFEGIEVGIRGAKSLPDADRVRQLDVLKLEVLNTGR